MPETLKTKEDLENKFCHKWIVQYEMGELSPMEFFNTVYYAIKKLPKCERCGEIGMKLTEYNSKQLCGHCHPQQF
ncbi:MAG TPA: hypothetical protein VN698_12960 [Bacteroidia bacterium]|nr:hypothetical protein [Bacteroidia bacterium]